MVGQNQSPLNYALESTSSIDHGVGLLDRFAGHVWCGTPAISRIDVYHDRHVSERFRFVHVREGRDDDYVAGRSLECRRPIECHLARAARSVDRAGL
jgi:hypothetical protein